MEDPNYYDHVYIKRLEAEIKARDNYINRLQNIVLMVADSLHSRKSYRIVQKMCERATKEFNEELARADQEHSEALPH